MEVSCATRSSPNFCSNSTTQTDMDGGMVTDTELYAKFRCHRKSFSFNRCSSSQFPQQMFVLNYIQLQFAASLLAWFWILYTLQFTQLHMGKSKHNRIVRVTSVLYENWQLCMSFDLMHLKLCIMHRVQICPLTLTNHLNRFTFDAHTLSPVRNPNKNAGNFNQMSKIKDILPTLHYFSV